MVMLKAIRKRGGRNPSSPRTCWTYDLFLIPIEYERFSLAWCFSHQLRTWANFLERWKNNSAWSYRKVESVKSLPKTGSIVKRNQVSLSIKLTVAHKGSQGTRSWVTESMVSKIGQLDGPSTRLSWRIWDHDKSRSTNIWVWPQGSTYRLSG